MKSIYTWQRTALVLVCSFMFLIATAGPFAAESCAAESVWRSLQTIERTVPSSGDCPGNVFLQGEEVAVSVPLSATAEVVRWRLHDDRGPVAESEFSASGPGKERIACVGARGIGWYRIEFLDADLQCLSWTTAAVLAELREPVPQDSPVCLDGAHAWFAKDDPEEQERMARLAALAGVNWIRDRMRWRDMEPEPGRFAGETTYDTSTDAQVRHGLKILQVFHDTPPWAVEPGSRRGRVPRDLRILYRFCKAMAERYEGRVQAWEPWNEANAHDFGGHTADEMCTFQKAAYLGFKAGDPELTVGWNAYAACATDLYAKVVLENETWPYYETYNMHTYDWPHSYRALWAPHRRAACGRPIWVTEADRGIQHEGVAPNFDLSPRNDRLKAELMAQEYTSSLYAGGNRHFHFILGHYAGREIQFGLVRPDLTPRPSYVALAAVGRFLAGAKCLGRWPVAEQPDTHVYAFRARPDGIERDLLVAWSEKQAGWDRRGRNAVAWPIPSEIVIDGIHDYLGRPLAETPPTSLTSAPLFVLLPRGETEKLTMEAQPIAEYRAGEPSSVVLQVQMPLSTVTQVKERAWTQEFEYVIEPGQDVELELYAYNFGDRPVLGEVTVEHAPHGWRLEPKRWQVALDLMQRLPLSLRCERAEGKGDKQSDTWIKIRGEFGAAGRPVQAFRLTSFPGEGYEN